MSGLLDVGCPMTTSVEDRVTTPRVLRQRGHILRRMWGLSHDFSSYLTRQALIAGARLFGRNAADGRHPVGHRVNSDPTARCATCTLFRGGRCGLLSPSMSLIDSQINLMWRGCAQHSLAPYYQSDDWTVARDILMSRGCVRLEIIAAVTLFERERDLQITAALRGKERAPTSLVDQVLDLAWWDVLPVIYVGVVHVDFAWKRLPWPRRGGPSEMMMMQMQVDDIQLQSLWQTLDGARAAISRMETPRGGGYLTIYCTWSALTRRAGPTENYWPTPERSAIRAGWSR